MDKMGRYIIVLDRMDDDEAVGPDGHWPTTDEEGMAQVAAELQEAMERTGQPAGFFRVVARVEPETHESNIASCDQKDAHQRAFTALADTRTY